MSEDKTHLGYQRVDPVDKERKVGAVFGSVASRYDLMNDLMSFGVHRLWKRFTVHISGVRRGYRVLDLAGGTGDLTRLFARRVGATGSVTLADINGSMIAAGRERLLDKGVSGNVTYVQTNAERLPFPDAHFHCLCIGFGLRNVTFKDRALAEMYRVLQPGGVALILEFSQMNVPALKGLYDAYSFKVLPAVGKLVVDDGDSYRYLAESIRMHPDQETLKSMMLEAGFDDCEYFNLSAGVVALHRGRRW
ncbi:MAG: bifunctional demethylmenaquinone methyltransferase/2-methoxy-6-polyprenyl-1,4-benzoquinol methylase UbiE [Gammaproteobacteria bacterium]|nr:MAG: bifunctional demethylmenaquinone methyltransferase/2-methoxy-6-polyprenyl-1,4-benzoquinol methylase UbiE [Gammaproteobacteria bacterium]